MIAAKPARHDTGAVLLSVLAAVAVLHFAEAVLMPVALALLLAFLLAPLAQRIERLGAMRAVAVALTCVVAFAAIGALVYVVAHQFIGLIEQLPAYQDNLMRKMKSLPGATGGAVARGVESLRELFDALQKSSPSPPGIAKVQIVEAPANVAQIVQALFGPLIRPASTGAIVIVFVIFMLQQREDLRDRFVRLLGASAMHTTLTALDDAAERVSRYLAMQTLINTIQGSLVAVGLYFIGLPEALLWGALTIVLRFVPYLGPALAAAGPIVLSVAFFPGWTQTLLVVGLIGVLELVTNNLLEPRLYGSSVGVSAFALLVAAVFWTWLWGVAGLFLATPLTVCLVVMGKYIPQLAFLGVMLGDQPVLEPHERFYQRLLANDPEQAEELLDEAAQTTSSVEVCDTLLLPALRIVEHDHERDAIDVSRRDAVLDQLADLIEAWSLAAPPKASEPGAGAPVAMRVLCLPAADRADELAALALAHVLAQQGFTAEAVPVGLKAELLERAADALPDAICISAVPPAAVIHARYLCKKLRTRVAAPGLPIVVGLWDAHGELDRARQRLAAVGADHVVASAAAAGQVLTELRRPLEQGVEPEAVAAP